MLRTVAGSNHADSISTFFVRSVIIGVEAAHHASQRDRLLRVGDDEVFGRELAVNAVERLQNFAFARAAHDDRAALQQIEIEGVRGMAKLVQRIVGGVSDVVDGARAQQLQTLDDVLRRRADLDVADDARGISRTALRVFDDDRETSICHPERSCP